MPNKLTQVVTSNISSQGNSTSKCYPNKIKISKHGSKGLLNYDTFESREWNTRRNEMKNSIFDNQFEI